MAIEDASDRAVFFDSDDFALAGVYTPQGGSAVAVTLILDGPGQRPAFGEGGFMTTGWTARLPADQVASCANGDALTADGQSFTVQRADRDETRKIWSLELQLAS